MVFESLQKLLLSATAKFNRKTHITMFFELSEEQKAVRDAARDFAQSVLKPGVIERDET